MLIQIESEPIPVDTGHAENERNVVWRVLHDARYDDGIEMSGNVVDIGIEL
jgi:hypothetical protein